jgi:kynurenine 3-monooxygenase
MLTKINSSLLVMTVQVLLLLLASTTHIAIGFTPNHQINTMKPLPMSSTTGTSTNTPSPSTRENTTASTTRTRTHPPRAIIVGGGPVGIASAIMLAHQSYDVTILESSSTEAIRAFNPALAYLYNVNARGQEFTKMFSSTCSIHENMVKKSVDSETAKFMLIPGDEKEEISYPDLAGVGGKDISYWVPRHEMTALLWDAVEEHNASRKEEGEKQQARSIDDEKGYIGKIDFHHGVTCVSVSPSQSTDDDESARTSSISVVVKDKKNGMEQTFVGKLVVGADGIKSRVRECLREGSDDSLFGTWSGYKAKKFEVKKWVSPATGLKIKVRAK